MEIPDEASDVSLGHWGQVAKSSCEKVPGVESPDEVLDVSSGHWGQVAVLSHDETPEVRLEHGVRDGAGTTDEASDEEHWGQGAALPHPDEAPNDEQREWVAQSSGEKVPGKDTTGKGTTGAEVYGRERPVAVPKG